MIQRLKFALFLLTAGIAWLAPTAKADDWDKRTVLTFNEPVEIPGKVLSAGTYVFKLADSESDRTVVQVFTQDEQHLVATVIAIPSYRPDPADKTIVTFEERPSGSPEALHKWYYPGDNFGLEFVYPKSEQSIAAASPRPEPTVVPSAAPEVPVAVEQAKSMPAPPVILSKAEYIVTPENAPALAPAADEFTEVNLPDELPQTAGNFAAIPLVGMMLLSGGIAVLRFATRQN